MTEHDIVIIGCGAAGGTAAQFARKTNRKASITIFEKGPFPQYSKCGLPYTISGEISNPMDLIEFSEDWFNKAKIDLHLKSFVKTINSKKKILQIGMKDGTIIEKEYTELIIATGSHPSYPPIKGIANGDTLHKGIFSVRTIDDANNIMKSIKKGQKATVIGAGLIGLEMADCLKEKGLDITVIEALPQILPMLDSDMANIVENEISNKIKVFTNHLATEVKIENNHIKECIIQDKETKNEHSLQTDILIIATGTNPETTLAKQAQCDIGYTGGIIVDKKSQTSIPHIYAIGDCTEYIDYVTKKPIQVGLGSIAVRQGIAAGINSAGGFYELPKGVLQTFTSKIFDIQIAAVGPHLESFESSSIIIGKHQGSSLPEYYPGGKPIIMKIAAMKENGLLVSAQAIGENAAQRINTYATAILGNMTFDQFRKLETAYAPPVAPTLDVVTIVADVISMKHQRMK